MSQMELWRDIVVPGDSGQDLCLSVKVSDGDCCSVLR